MATRKHKGRKYSDDLVMAMLEAKSGNIAAAAKGLGVQRATLYAWIDKSKALSKALNDIRESGLDFTEQQAMLLIKGVPKMKEGKLVGWEEKPDGAMIRYMLSTKGKHRGYTEKQEVEHSGQVTFVWHEEKTYETDPETDGGT